MAQRLFIGFDLPEKCAKSLASIAEPLRGVRWLTGGPLHLTLAFLGDTEPEARDRLIGALGAVRVPPFLLKVRGIGTFGRPRPSVIWAGVGTGHPHLFALHKAVHDALFAAGFDPELRSFHPHFTIARVKDASPESLRPFLRKHADTQLGSAAIDCFRLYSSQLLAEGSQHTSLMRWDLEGK